MVYVISWRRSSRVQSLAQEYMRTCYERLSANFDVTIPTQTYCLCYLLMPLSVPVRNHCQLIANIHNDSMESFSPLYIRIIGTIITTVFILAFVVRPYVIAPVDTA
jgi:hypothetical protein